MTQAKPQKLMSPVGRCSYLYLEGPAPKQKPTDDDSYEVTLLVDPAGQQTSEWRQLIAAITAAVQAAYPQGAPPGFHWNVSPCAQLPKYASQFPGYMRVKFKSRFKPDLVSVEPGPDGKPRTLLPGEAYSGCWGRVTYHVYVFNKSGNTGVSLTLHNFQKVRDDTKFSNSSGADDFGGATEANPFGGVTPGLGWLG